MKKDRPPDAAPAPPAAGPHPIPEQAREAAPGAVSAPKAATLREQLEERLREAPDILSLLASPQARPLMVAGQDDLWATVRHFVTTTRGDAAVEFPRYLDKLIRKQLKLGEGDPIPSSRLSEVKTLDLRGTQVTDAGLAHLKGLAGLNWLWLSGTEVTDAGLAHLKGLAGLHVLSLVGTQVTDAGLAHLKGLAGLQWLYLTDTQVTSAGWAELHKALPECKIL
ncbi:MAG: hypothetical protein IH986_02675 [Planctomycetes bacterium]|nr:hypothetical protein [Planctomycetota bacterium]